MEPNPSGEPAQRTGIGHTIWEWVKVIAVALLISLPIRFFIAEPFVVNGASMDPTFASDQFLIVDRLTYRFDAPKRGDVIIFEYPNDPSVYYIKRIIGLPNETISIKDGSVYIINEKNPEGLALKEPYIDASHRSHDTLTATTGPSQYFVMGDNRAQSSDSRVWGDLDKKFIIGRPIVRLIPLDEISILPGEYNKYGNE